MKIITKALMMSATLLSTMAIANEQTLNIYNWADYIPPQTIQDFEKKTGINVNIDAFDSNNMLEAKLLAGNSGYDLVFPGGGYLQRQLPANIYSPIDKSLLSNYKNLEPEMLQKVASHDPKNQFGVPYTWGTIGIAYNKKQVKKMLGDIPIDSFKVLLDEENASKLAECGIAIIDTPNEVLSGIQNHLGLDPKSENSSDMRQAVAALKKIRPHIRYFDSGKITSDLANEEICIAITFSGVASLAQLRADEAGNGVEIAYSIPKEGTMIWFDMMAIPADAKHKQAAHLFINFVLDANVAANISNYLYYAVPNQAALSFIDPIIKEDGNTYPNAQIRQQLFPEMARSAKYSRQLSRAWSNLKAGK